MLGERYVGNWTSNRMNGQGKYYFRNGDVFLGNFINDIAQGEGTYFHCKSKQVYNGRCAV